MEKFAFTLTSEWIALNDLLKVTGLVHSGGTAKLMIADEQVHVDGKVETRKTCKIRAGQTVTLDGAVIVVLPPAVA
jgi:ribosome-associated protein